MVSFLGSDQGATGDRLRGAAREFVCIAGHLVLYPTGLFPTGLLPGAVRPLLSSPGAPEPELDAPSSATGERLPVVLVHGLADNHSIFAVLRRTLRRHGFGQLHHFDHNPLGGDVRAKAELLQQHIERVCEATGAAAVHVIGHSLGGLVARYHAQLVNASLVDTVVTLGTPHGGTYAAYVMRPHPLVRQMCPDSPVIAELAEPIEGCRTRFVAYWGDLDPLVLPCSSGAIAHPDLDARSVLVTGAGHLTLPQYGRVADEVCRLLAREIDGEDGATIVAA